MPPTVRAARSLLVTKFAAPAKVMPVPNVGSVSASQFAGVLQFPLPPPPSQVFAAMAQGNVPAASKAAMVVARTNGRRKAPERRSFMALEGGLAGSRVILE